MVSVEDEPGGVTRDVRGVSRKSTILKTARGLGRVYGLQLTRQHDSAYGLPWRKTQWAKNETMLAHFCQCDGPIHLSLTRFVLPLSANDFVQFVWRFAATWKFARLTKERLWYLYFISFTMIYCCFFFSMVSSKVVRVGRFFRKAPY